MTHSIQLHSPLLQVPRNSSPDRQHAENLQNQFGRQVAARLSESACDLPYDISERLRAVREQAIAKRKLSLRAAPAVVSSAGANVLSMDGERPGFWGRMAAVLPLIALVAGLVAINMVQSEERANELAEVDAALLTDDLPPAAYADPGFAQFLRTGSENARP